MITSTEQSITSLSGSLQNKQSDSIHATKRNVQAPAEVGRQIQEAVKLDLSRVKPAEKNEKGRNEPTDEEEKMVLKENVDADTQPEPSGSHYAMERNQELNRTFLVVKDPQSDEEMYKIPSEQLAKILAALQDAAAQDKAAGGGVDVKY